MILDKQNMIAEAQVITATAASQNQVDLGPSSHAGNSHGTKWPDLVPVVTQSFVGAGTLTIQVRDATQPNMSDARVVTQSAAFTAADLQAGVPVNWYPALPVSSRRYVDANFVVAGGSFTAGALTLGMAMTRPTNR